MTSSFDAADFSDVPHRRRFGGSLPGVSKRRGALAHWLDERHARRRYVATTADLRALGLSTSALYASLGRLEAAGRLIAVGGRRGLWAIVPAEYRTMGAPPVTWLLDDIMRVLGQPYYVGLGSAAAHYGATHYALQALHVMTPHRLRAFSLGRVRVRFLAKPGAAQTPVRDQVDVTRTRYSTPEATALDLVRFMSHAGGVSRVATMLQEMAGRFSPDDMRVALAAASVVSDAQRLGYLWNLIGQDALASVVREWLDGRLLRTVALESRQPPTAEAVIDATWKVRVDHPVDLSL